MGAPASGAPSRLPLIVTLLFPALGGGLVEDPDLDRPAPDLELLVASEPAYTAPHAPVLHALRRKQMNVCGE